MTNSIRRLRFRSLTLVPCLLASAVAFAQPRPATAQQPVSSLDTQAFARSGQVWRSFGNDLPFASPSSWPIAGGGYFNSRFAPGEWKINRTTAKTLKPAWTLTTTGDISATPSVEGGTLYVPDWGGTLYSVDTQTGKPNWQAKLSDYTGKSTSLSRTTPAITPKSIILGDMSGGTVLALDKKTGKLLWKSEVETNPQAQITSSPVVYGNRIYLGVSSRDYESLDPTHRFSFRGSVVALDLNTGKKVWQFYNAPEGYTGASTWGQVAIDPIARRLYFGTGNNYNIPQSVGNCVSNARSYRGSALTVQDELDCMAPDNYVDSVISLNLDTGKLVWANRAQGYDAWNLSCIVAPTNGLCPNTQATNLTGPDYDFGGAGVQLFTVWRDGKPQQLIGAGQKSGIYWAFDAKTGAKVWSTQVGPGGTTGGVEWGTAFDPYKSQVYVAINNSSNASYTLGPANTERHNGGSWAALDAATGKIKWQVKVPGINRVNPTVPAGGQGSLTVSPNLLYAGSMAGNMVALDTDTGATLWNYDAAGSVISSPAIANGALYWGAGYGRFNFGTAATSNQLIKFVPDSSAAK
ncbi:PQQ-binding-like beta-propeller repeat protein [Xanthomonas hortorum pv. vitians]|uniref:PQQ-binding-like beta-propeller repeat protein n=1 Tax=Xanthomonas hortorum pv. vitians TaxID=83224 RepID=A0A6V7C2W5_9XANT|nr:PQQ-binding-like beta-propeller repeat protein [Xanthomonas hortorum]APP83084.1 polyvinylalcohol dehydrogenase [Xanthomonas hortorum pv. gardneri]ASW47083.1 polyvinylalcohol dehydrogenase [Xanthomonas hortorum]MCC8495310.1 PQQ-binding-like beta-propeller repeat protein [Xanthomonas hortorum pv. gardneri]MCE4297757.1 PQQ-binding-like beta-propeller repeat protein [Xanthomonas hortorum pv. vitians]MCE4301134.1 PQQ-binding-like beta-propeller repeat protein [Xanthomonas hortorum pv. vitians]